MMNEAISCDPHNPDIFEIEGSGRVEYLEFENDIWISEIYATKRGSGLFLMREFIKYAKDKGKALTGRVFPTKEGDVLMSPERIVRLYRIFGARLIEMDGFETVMRLETTQ